MLVWRVVYHTRRWFFCLMFGLFFGLNRLKSGIINEYRIKLLSRKNAENSTVYNTYWYYLTPFIRLFKSLLLRQNKCLRLTAGAFVFWRKEGFETSSGGRPRQRHGFGSDSTVRCRVREKKIPPSAPLLSSFRTALCNRISKISRPILR